MKVLLAASEAAPIIKLGGLGDVIGSLPKALQKKGVNTDIIVPYFPTAETKNLKKIYKALELNVPFDQTTYSVEVFKTQLPESDVDIFLLRNAHFFAQGGKSAFANNVTETEMFMFFNKAVVEFIKSQFNTYDLIHCHDWHTGLIPHLLNDEIGKTRPATLFTIHNLMYQGMGDRSLVEEIGFVPGQHPLIDWDLEDGDLNMMLQGITSSDYINTVSKTYAHEIVTKEHGGDFAEILRSRSGRLSGILNGLDYSMFPRYYDVPEAKKGKLSFKKKLFEKLDFSYDSLEDLEETPVFGFVGRLDPGQKGLDILHEFLKGFPKRFSEEILSQAQDDSTLSFRGNALPAQTGEESSEASHEATRFGQDGKSQKPKFVILGVGDPKWEKKLQDLAASRSDISANIVFDEALARLIYSASDFLLVPSRYEPCGLIQMIAMWYGSLPIVRAVGGLKDSVKPGVTGFVFDDYSSEALFSAVEKALKVFDDMDRLKTMRKNAMREDFSWERSAGEYKELYERVVKMRGFARDLG